MQRERRSKSILIVEDSPTTKALIKAIVEEMGDFNTVEAGSGFEALKILPTQEFDLVITDINMPDINGLDILQRIRTMFRDLPVILSSAYPEYQQNLTTWASDAYVVKSSNLANLKAAIKKILGE